MSPSATDDAALMTVGHLASRTGLWITVIREYGALSTSTKPPR